MIGRSPLRLMAYNMLTRITIETQKKIGRSFLTNLELGCAFLHPFGACVLPVRPGLRCLPPEMSVHVKGAQSTRRVFPWEFFAIERMVVVHGKNLCAKNMIQIFGYISWYFMAGDVISWFYRGNSWWFSGYPCFSNRMLLCQDKHQRPEMGIQQPYERNT